MLIPALAFQHTYTQTVEKEGSVFRKRQQHERTHRGVGACGVQGTVGAMP